MRQDTVAKADAFPVSSFHQLVEIVAQMAYLNKDHLLFFRGQGQDYRRDSRASTFFPAIYRGPDPRRFITRKTVVSRFEHLSRAAEALCNRLDIEGMEGYEEVRRRRYVQWSILQHYEVCPSPLLDFTQSLRVACSFAYLAYGRGRGSGPIVAAFALPYITNRISNNSEHDIVNIRLLSICPPDALRPQFQQGFLAGTDEVTTGYKHRRELDFNRRLVAKFRLPPPEDRFSQRSIGILPQKALYPKKDPMKAICDEVKQEL
jgi:hypothetical protein